jgi:cytoskeletal protein CcmA (bactofilin family)
MLTSSVVSADVRLTGNVGPITIDDNVIIPQNSTVTLNGTTIRGNVFVRSGARLFTYAAIIEGNVQATGSFVVDLRNQSKVGGDVQGYRTRTVRVREGTAVDGNVQIKEARASIDVDALQVNFASVDGDVQAEKSSGRFRVRDSYIGGNLQFIENTTGPYVANNNDIAGDLQHFKNRGKATATNNDVGGNLQVEENFLGPYRIASNQIAENLQFFKNNGFGDIIRNYVGGNLQSKENQPQPNIKNNIVDGDLEVE